MQIAQTPTWCGRMLALLLVVVGIMLATTAASAAEFPTSGNPAKGKWVKMKPSSFSGSMASVIEQCNRAANMSKADALSPVMCQRLPQLITEKRCKVAMVPDGIVFDFMNGAEQSGRSRITQNVEKALGRFDRAFICDLGNRTFAYWFTGEKDKAGKEKSCQNVGIVFTALPQKAAPPPPAPVKPAPDPVPPKVAPPAASPPPETKTAEPEPPAKTCRWVLTGTGQTSTQVIEIQGRVLDSCLGPWFVPGQVLLVPGGATTTHTWVCN